MAVLTSVTPHSSTYNLHLKFHSTHFGVYLNSTIETNTCRLKQVGFPSRRPSLNSLHSGLRIRAAATKPAKSPGIFAISALTQFHFIRNENKRGHLKNRKQLINKATVISRLLGVLSFLFLFGGIS